MDRDTFAKRQAAMTSNWYENVKRTHGDVKAYIASRHRAYLDRWQEAGRFIPDGAKILDIGGGNLFPALLEYIKSKRLDYHYLDIDETAVDGSRNLAAEHGFDPNKFSQGFNDQFAFENEAFDCIFSSHCVEHSINLSKTFSELNRILRPDGFLLMAVPFGWEENPEHPYFFNPEQWITLVEDAGFEIRIAQIGREYPEHGYDFFIAARKKAPYLITQRLDPNDYRKENYDYVSFTDPCISYFGNKQITHEGNAAHLRGDDWSIEIKPAVKISAILPIFLNHDWSAAIETSVDGRRPAYTDLFSWFPYVQPVRLGIPPGKSFSPIIVTPIGKNASSRSTEGVFYGFMYR